MELTKNKVNPQTLSVRKMFIILTILFLFISSVASASDYGLGIVGLLNKYLSVIIAIFRPVTGIAIIVTLFLAFKGSPVWTMGLVVCIVCGIVANLDKILDWTGLTGGVVF